jgi:hypothetical protein
MSELVFLLEELSAEAMLKGLLPRILPSDITTRYIVFEGKQDLEKQLVRKIGRYQVPDAKFVVFRDQDAGDCKAIKRGLVEKCRQAGQPDALVRIACRELESWYLADLAAVERGMQVSGLVRLQGRMPYRSPDSQIVPSDCLARIVSSYQKVGGSRAIGPHLDLNNTRSRSFVVFVTGIHKLLENAKNREAMG